MAKQPTKQLETVFNEHLVLDLSRIIGFTDTGVIIDGGTLIPLDQQEEINNLLYVWQVARGAKPELPVIQHVDGIFTTVTFTAEETTTTPEAETSTNG